MRKDHYSPPRKWTLEYAQALKIGPEHFAVYALLESGPDSHATGLYWTTVARVADLVRMQPDEVERFMGDLDRTGLIQWDAEANVVLVPCMCAEQFRWKKDGKPKGGDKRIPEAVAHLSQLPPTYLLERFLSVWPQFRDGSDEGASQGAWQGASPNKGHDPKPLNQLTPKGASQGACQGATPSPLCDSDPQRDQGGEPWLKYAV